MILSGNDLAELRSLLHLISRNYVDKGTVVDSERISLPMSLGELRRLKEIMLKIQPNETMNDSFGDELVECEVCEDKPKLYFYLKCAHEFNWGDDKPTTVEKAIEFYNKVHRGKSRG